MILTTAVLLALVPLGATGPPADMVSMGFSRTACTTPPAFASDKALLVLAGLDKPLPADAVVKEVCLGPAGVNRSLGIIYGDPLERPGKPDRLRVALLHEEKPGQYARLGAPKDLGWEDFAGREMRGPLKFVVELSFRVSDRAGQMHLDGASRSLADGQESEARSFGLSYELHNDNLTPSFSRGSGCCALDEFSRRVLPLTRNERVWAKALYPDFDETTHRAVSTPGRVAELQGMITRDWPGANGAQAALVLLRWRFIGCERAHALWVTASKTWAKPLSYQRVVELNRQFVEKNAEAMRECPSPDDVQRDPPYYSSVEYELVVLKGQAVVARQGFPEVSTEPPPFPIGYEYAEWRFEPLSLEIDTQDVAIGVRVDSHSNCGNKSCDDNTNVTIYRRDGQALRPVLSLDGGGKLTATPRQTRGFFDLVYRKSGAKPARYTWTGEAYEPAAGYPKPSP